MKKFISMVMAAAMVVSLVPATAFAASVGSTTAKVVDKYEVTVNDAAATIMGAELQLVMNGVDAKATAAAEEVVFTLEVENATFGNIPAGAGAGRVVRPSSNNEVVGAVNVTAAVTAGAEEIEVKITETSTNNFTNGDVICIALNGLAFEKTKLGTEATIKATGDIKSDEVVFAAIVEKGIKAELNDDCVDVAPEEVVEIETIVIEPNVGDTFDSVVDTAVPTETTLKLNKGFEFVGPFFVEYFDAAGASIAKFESTLWGGFGLEMDIDGNEIAFESNLAGVAKIEITELEVEAATADAGDVANVKVKMGKLNSVTVEEVVKVVDYKVVMTLVDPDEDVPVFYNGVDSNNTGLTDDADHVSLAVNIKETFPGAWSNHKEFTLSLPEGVHVVENGVVVTGTTSADEDTLFQNAYVKGNHEEFVFAKRVFNETTPGMTENELEFTLKLVADPDFVGDVTLTLEGAAVDTQEVVIAKFVAPYTIEAAQNDVIIDYRYTEVPTEIVITEAEAGLWADGLKVGFAVERGDMIQFEDDAVVTVNEESEMEIEDECYISATEEYMGFEVTEESDEEAAVITISGIELFMQRNIPAGPYALEVAHNDATIAFAAEKLYAWDADETVVDDVADYSTTAHEAFINVITAGRDKDDASFTKKVVVPVGESYLIAGEETVALEVPAYINADGYTMLPVRAVATALGINNNNVIWSQAAKQVTILYGQRIITMTAGEAVVYVNASSIPASAAVEIVNGRAFLPLRDLANALGVTEIGWDAATSTATLN